MIKVNITRAQKRIEELMQRADAGEEVILLRRNVPAVRLGPVPEGMKIVPLLAVPL